MNSKAALCKALLDGVVVNIRNIHTLTGYTNAAREVGRNIEREKDGGFGVIVSRTKMEGKNRYGVQCFWTNYRLNQTKYNAEGIAKMKEYIQKEMSTINPKTTKEANQLKQLSLLP